MQLHLSVGACGTCAASKPTIPTVECNVIARESIIWLYVPQQVAACWQTCFGIPLQRVLGRQNTPSSPKRRRRSTCQLHPPLHQGVVQRAVSAVTSTQRHVCELAVEINAWWQQGCNICLEHWQCRVPLALPPQTPCSLSHCRWNSIAPSGLACSTPKVRSTIEPVASTAGRTPACRPLQLKPRSCGGPKGRRAKGIVGAAGRARHSKRDKQGWSHGDAE
jgi:hypothetical protein